MTYLRSDRIRWLHTVPLVVDVDVRDLEDALWDGIQDPSNGVNPLKWGMTPHAMGLNPMSWAVWFGSSPTYLQTDSEFWSIYTLAYELEDNLW